MAVRFKGIHFPQEIKKSVKERECHYSSTATKLDTRTRRT
jgi:hypothetical protein